MANQAGKTILQLDIDELENAIKHLTRSNKEIEEFIKENPDEREEFESVLEENNVAMKTKLERLQKLKDELEKAMATGSGHDELSSTTAETEHPAARPQAVRIEASKPSTTEDDTGLTL